MKTPRIRRLLLAILIFELGVAAGVSLAHFEATRSLQVAHLQAAHHMSGVMVDWAHVRGADLEIAKAFIAAQASGVGVALDTLRSLAARDSSVRMMSPTMLHHIAHSLGRFAVELKDYDPSVMLGCRVGYAAGCYHGVMEGYFSHHPELDSTFLANLCERIAPRSPPLAERECAHGMGHGLMELADATVDRALAYCGYLKTGVLQRECYDGVFMTTVDSPMAAVAGTAPMSMVNDQRNAPTGAGNRAGCENLDTRYVGACWAYRPRLLIDRAHGELSMVVRECDLVALPARADCYYGVGKQGAGLYPSTPSRVAEGCRSGDASYGAACRAGAVAYYTDIDWTADQAVVFCSRLQENEKSDCYRSVGANMRLMQIDGTSLKRECGKAGRVFQAKCLAGAE